MSVLTYILITGHVRCAEMKFLRSTKNENGLVPKGRGHGKGKHKMNIQNNIETNRL
jgi:hypothetical protein